MGQPKSMRASGVANYQMANDRKVMKQSATGLSLPLNKMDMQGDVSMADFISEDNIQSQ